MYDATVVCAVCDAPVLISMAVWNNHQAQAPAAICDDCDVQVLWPIFLVLVKLRSQVQTLMQPQDASQTTHS